MAARKQHLLVAEASRAPGFRLDLLSGGETSLTELIADGPVLLAFFKVTCPVCQLTLPYLDRIHASGRLRIYGVSQNDPDDTRDFNREYGISFPTLLDSEDANFPASNAYGISSVPTMFLIESDGTIAKVIEGWARRDIEELASQAGVPLLRPGERVPDWKAG